MRLSRMLRFIDIRYLTRVSRFIDIRCVTHVYMFIDIRNVTRVSKARPAVQEQEFSFRVEVRFFTTVVYSGVAPCV